MLSSRARASAPAPRRAHRLLALLAKLGDVGDGRLLLLRALLLSLRRDLHRVLELVLIPVNPETRPGARRGAARSCDGKGQERCAARLAKVQAPEAAGRQAQAPSRRKAGDGSVLQRQADRSAAGQADEAQGARAPGLGRLRRWFRQALCSCTACLCRQDATRCSPVVHAGRRAGTHLLAELLGLPLLLPAVPQPARGLQRGLPSWFAALAIAATRNKPGRQAGRQSRQAGHAGQAGPRARSAPDSRCRRRQSPPAGTGLARNTDGPPFPPAAAAPTRNLPGWLGSARGAGPEGGAGARSPLLRRLYLLLLKQKLLLDL